MTCTEHRCQMCHKAIELGRWYCDRCLEVLRSEDPWAAREEEADRAEAAAARWEKRYD